LFAPSLRTAPVCRSYKPLFGLVFSFNIGNSMQRNVPW
jgi:hypothetical protein